MYLKQTWAEYTVKKIIIKFRIFQRIYKEVNIV